MKQFEGKGNYAINKYYKFPYRFFYRKKLKMIVNLLPKGKVFYNILDFGSGPGIFTDQLKQHSIHVNQFESNDVLDPRWHYDAIVCASVLEFCSLNLTISILYNILNPGGKLFVASPMNTALASLYFKSIGDKQGRNSHKSIISAVSKRFRIEKYDTWMNLYFALRASRS